MSAAADPLLERFRAYCDQYLGVSRALGDAMNRTGGGDPTQQIRAFLEALTGLQQQVAGMWTATPLAAPLAAAPFAATASGAANPFAGFIPFAAAAPFVMPWLAAGPLSGGAFGAAGQPWAALLPGAAAAGFMPGSAPALGPTRELQEMWQRTAKLGEQLQQAQLRLLEQWNGIVTTALQRLGDRANALLEATPSPETLRSLYDQWIEAAEGAYAQAAHGPAFAAAQAELGNAHSQLRSAQREYLELAAREFDLPTRTEFNSVLQQLRDLKRALHELEERPAGRGPQAP
jgi:hypothetical protein